MAAVGSGPLLLKDAQWYEDAHAPAPDERDVPWPVIAVGTEADGTLLFAAVDGRHPERSVGMGRPAFAELLRRFGAVDAMALDSGGSVTMVSRAPGAKAVTVRNVPSDDSAERYVTDALFVYSSAPAGTIVTKPRPARRADAAGGAMIALPPTLAPPAPFPLIVEQASLPEFVAPGVQRADYRLMTSDGPLVVHVVAVDVHDPTVRLGSVVARDRLISNGETVESMALRSGAVAGINADYFDIGNTNQPLNVVVRDGVLVRTPSKRAALEVGATADRSRWAPSALPASSATTARASR